MLGGSGCAIFADMSFERPIVGEILAAMERKLQLVQVLMGPRQVGKTTAATQIEKRLGWPSVVASADSALPHPPEWIETQWRLARARAASTRTRVLLVLDEIQKVPGWSEVIKRLWDEEVAEGAVSSQKISVLNPTSYGIARRSGRVQRFRTPPGSTSAATRP